MAEENYEAKLMQWFDTLSPERQAAEAKNFLAWSLTQDDISLQKKRELLAVVPQCATKDVPPQFTSAMAELEKEVVQGHRGA